MIIVSDPTKFLHKGSILESMYRSVSQESKLISEYKLLPPKNPRQLKPEMQAALDEVDKTAKRGKKVVDKKEAPEEPSSKPSKSKKSKADKGESSATKKIKKMARRNLTSSPSHSDPKDNQSAGDDDEGQHQGSPRGNTPPRSPTPEVLVNDFVPTPPLSPHKTTIQVTVAPPPPSSTPIVSTIAPPPPVISTPITTAPLPPPIFSNATVASIPIITSTVDSSVKVNTYYVGAKTEESPKVTTEPLSPTPYNDSNLVFGGADF
ncbi:pollen-specific leucine-rich repeat extensin-like protein 4 [Lactuca sativa]|uniref:pollen-specific leucine-rich repeat extensin-like protein 4 n=1 Tax=Lactuca sativa TaxID=4236 RepID=UPI000CD9CE6D|nr:pollen-specific leucine-rich repeat extensin-like protein 4 [Lactuca sativa]